MMDYGRRWFAAMLLGVGALLVSPMLVFPAAVAGERLTVVELFTSQGCPRCPNADAFLAELATRDDVLALGFHVDYWDYMGWPDGMAAPDYTARQRAYASRLGMSYVYTPQIIVDGMWQEVGSKRPEVEAHISTAATITRERLDVELTLDGASRVRIQVTGTSDAGADVRLVRFDANRLTAIKGGENRGRDIVYVNVVRDMRTVAEWQGRPLDVTVELAPGGDGCAVIVQQAGPGPVLGAAWLMTPGAD